MLKDIFKDSIWYTSYKTDLNSFVQSYIQNNPTGRQVSNKGGYQSEDLDLTDPSLSTLVTYITKQAHAYGKALNYNTKKYFLSNMWLNVNNHKDYNEPHIHSGCVFAGVYYIDVQGNQGDITFTRHDSSLKECAFDNHNYDTPYTWSKAHIKPINHMCILFPGSTVHSVQPNPTKQPRVSVSFNILQNPSEK